jgi:hypothetical protein
MTPIFVGSTLKGYLYTTLSDPYHFYRGGIWSLIFETFFPAICVIILVLTVWFYACNRWFLKPYLESLVELQREQAFFLHSPIYQNSKGRGIVETSAAL